MSPTHCHLPNPGAGPMRPLARERTVAHALRGQVAIPSVMSSRIAGADAIRTLLRREESYAVHAIAYVAENPGAPTAQIAQDLKLPPAFLAKVLRRLAQAGFVENRTGRSGGVTLKVDPHEISLLDVIQTVSGPLILDTCQTHQRCATQLRKGHCNINGMWVRTTLAIHDLFGAVKMSTLIDPEYLSAWPQPATA